MTRSRALLLFLVPVLSAARAYGEEAAPLVVNGDFSDWNGASPRGWVNSEGARTGLGPASKVTKGPDGGARLAGDDATGSWRMLGQVVALPAGGTYRLAYEGRFAGGPPGEGQKGNVYVGVRLVRASGKQFLVDSPLRTTWTSGEVLFRPGDATAEVLVFLSRSGAMDVRGVRLETLAPKQSFDVLVASMARYYPFFEHTKFDWAKHAESLRERAALAGDAASFSALLRDLLGPLHDLHVSFQAPGGTRESAGIPKFVPNINARLKDAVKGLRPVGKEAELLVAEAAPGIPYLAFIGLQGGEEDWKRIEEAVLGVLPDSKGLVLDLRANKGGNELRARQIVRHLADQPRLYARRYFRSGPAPGDFGPANEAWIRPVGGASVPYTKPIVVLLGPACVSSGEGMAQMLDVLPHVRTVGLPTRGASASPAHVPLPNDFDVWYSTWKNEQADGTLLEGRGVQPDVLLEHKGDGDPTLAAGLAELRQMLPQAK